MTIFAGSFLLFMVEPMVARMVLPRLGGAPAVWNSAMLVYQVLLLGGYAFAHWLGRFSPRTQGFVQAGGLLLAALMLPLHLLDAVPPPNADAYLWVPWLLIMSIGPLLLFISAQAPLVQRWFALSGGGDPYPLYAASNLGSFAGLLSYPLLVEPLLTVTEQARYWSVGYLLLLVLVALTAARLPRVARADARPVADQAPLSRKIVARWIMLAAIPSGLMLSTTLHLTTDLVAMPLLWVGPLGLYLLSFSVAFAQNRLAARVLGAAAPLLLITASWTVFAGVSPWALSIAALSLLTMFALSVAIHAILFDERPDPSRLTAFYLAMSVGGVVGGLFCALAAPLLFDWAYEHPILMLAAAYVLGDRTIVPALAKRWADPAMAGRVARLGGLALIAAALFLANSGLEQVPVAKGGMIALFSLAALVALGNRLLFTAAIAALMLLTGGLERLALSVEPGRMTRSFFGVDTIGVTPDHARVLFHGTTVHGIELLGSPERERTAVSYYNPNSGIGLAMRAAPALFGGAARIDVVGLGAGTLACYAQPGQSWRFYEIDPVVVGIARHQFSFLSRCAPGAPIEVGDARLTLAGKPGASADLLAIDAFSSDSVPMHLLTLEAFDLYRRHLASDGLLMVHISNRFLDLEPVLAEAAAKGWVARIRYYDPPPAERARYYTHSLWVAMSPSAATIEALERASPPEAWRTLRRRDGATAWTDDYSTILPVIRWQDE
ncbi:fused MFS/spermidine synthase [Sphingomonas sp. ASV193]|uniref:fused MFS/spermidine synthase n=1 Tax=Sphingomonas sp. ASV193 TaxID=3144405 RepID=UPI0032E88D01